MERPVPLASGWRTRRVVPIGKRMVRSNIIGVPYIPGRMDARTVSRQQQTADQSRWCHHGLGQFQSTPQKILSHFERQSLKRYDTRGQLHYVRFRESGERQERRELPCVPRELGPCDTRHDRRRQQSTHFADRERSTPRYDTSFDSIEGIPCELTNALCVDVSFGAPISVF
jgi:hypothetical protein